MKCPYCGGVVDRVLDSREIREGQSVWRRRECSSCARRFTTYEEIEIQPFWVVKEDERREPFDRKKILRGLQLALNKRPVSTEAIEKMVENIEHTLYQTGRKEVHSREIGGLVMKKLKAIDEVAYVRFASVYRKFEDASQFRDVLKVLADIPKKRIQRSDGRIRSRALSTSPPQGGGKERRHARRNPKEKSGFIR